MDNLIGEVRMIQPGTNKLKVIVSPIGIRIWFNPQTTVVRGGDRQMNNRARGEDIKPLAIS